jgi:tetratricopeptide (TPR) repeat protein
VTSQFPPKKRRLRKAIGPRLRRLLALVFGLFAVLAVDSLYLVGVTALEWATGRVYQNWLYMVLFLVHLTLGVALILPVVLFGILHVRNTYNRPNRRAVWVGYGLFGTALLLIGSGVVLTRIEGLIVVNDPAIRAVAYWLHVLTPLVAVWLFVLHRLAGRRIRWEVGRRWAAVAAVFAAVMLVFQLRDPRRWNVEGPESGEQYFFPSLARTATGDFIPPRVLANDQYCKRCHEDSHRGWSSSVHRFSSFNNPAYLFSVRETRRVAFERDGDVQASRFCAGCHDPVPFFSGRFDDPVFDDESDPTAHAGITCTSCHAIVNINSVRGNSDYTIEEPIHYPFTFSRSSMLRFVNEQLVKAKPEFHKKTFLKPLHSSPEFCGSCHKVHLPEELNGYKWLRGQNHYDSYHLSGVSGHGVASFYYPEQAEHDCNGCHMPLEPSDQFAARDFDGSGQLEIHGHQFPSANTAVPFLLGQPPEVIEAHRAFNEGVVRIDLFAVREGGTIDGHLLAPLRPLVPRLAPGRSYLVDVVIRTLKLGHAFTQGTADSNEIWLDVVARSGGRLIGRSGATAADGTVDPWSHFVNAYVLDRDGNRIDRRNAQDIFVSLYDHQIPPGAADTVHFRLDLPPDLTAPVEIDVALRYRKFDTTYMQHVFGPDYVNELPIMTLAEDRIVLPLATGVDVSAAESSAVPEWERWNDWGIGLLRKGGKSKGELRQAERAFSRVEELGRPEGAVNLARVYLAQGTVRDAAVAALERAASFEPPAPAWTVAWFSGLVNMQNGFLDEAIRDFENILALDDAETRAREFDFSQDYRLLNELGQTLFERAKLERDRSSPARVEFLEQARDRFLETLRLDPENVTAHYNLDLVYKQLGERERAQEHFALYRKYKPDDNARDRAIAKHRAENPAADHAAEAIVIYELSRPGVYGLGGGAAPEAASTSRSNLAEVG